MLTLGRACLYLGLVIAPCGIGASLYGAWAGKSEWIAVGRRAVFTLAGILTVAFIVLEAAFIRSDFSFAVVASHSSTTTPLFYRLTAMWSSQEGSMLLWVWLLSIWSSVALIATRRRLTAITPYATATLLVFASFFLALAAFAANPFQLLDPAPSEGAGLEPLLRHPSMMVHPPLLYSGYTLFTIPFAFAIGALITRRVDAGWIRATRRFGLAAWLCLGVGILLGARWSWGELGWGGYWAWDPVENAALMPWLTGTAYLHSVMVQERRGMLKTWNVSLVLATGVLAVLGTFLVRSGILQSIHAFGASTLGKPFLGFIAVLVGASLVLVVSRRDALRSESPPYSVFSREAIFLLNNLVLVGLCVVIFWGTFFPLISEALSGHKDSVGPPWFDHYTAPLAIVLVLLSGIGPAAAWRHTTVSKARRSLLAPLALAAATTVVLLLAGAGRSVSSTAMFAAAAFVVAVLCQELWRAVGVRRSLTGEPRLQALRATVRRSRRRYGGYIVHIGMAVLFVGVAASSAFAHVKDVVLSPGQSTQIDGYTVRYVHATSTVTSERVSLGAVLDISRRGHRRWTLRTSRGYYPTPDPSLGPTGRYFGGNTETQIGLQAGLLRDVWTSVQPDIGAMQPMINGIDQRFPQATGAIQRTLLGAIADRYRLLPPSATFRIIVSPLVEWIWLGGLFVAAGGLLALWPAPATARAALRSARRAGAGAAARLAGGLSRA